MTGTQKPLRRISAKKTRYSLRARARRSAAVKEKITDYVNNTETHSPDSKRTERYSLVERRER